MICQFSSSWKYLITMNPLVKRWKTLHGNDVPSAEIIPQGKRVPHRQGTFGTDDELM